MLWVSYEHESLYNVGCRDGHIYITIIMCIFILGNSVKNRDGEEEGCSRQKGNTRGHSCMVRMGYMLEGRRNERKWQVTLGWIYALLNQTLLKTLSNYCFFHNSLLAYNIFFLWLYYWLQILSLQLDPYFILKYKHWHQLFPVKQGPRKMKRCLLHAE